MRLIKSLSIVVLALLTIASCSVSQNKERKKTDLDEMDLKGKVKSVKESEYKAVNKFGEIEKGEVQREPVYLFNTEGNITELAEYNSDGSLDKKWIYKYDDKGNKVERAWYESDGSLNQKYTYEYEYDKQGNWIKKITYWSTTPEDVTEREIEYYD